MREMVCCQVGRVDFDVFWEVGVPILQLLLQLCRERKKLGRISVVNLSVWIPARQDQLVTLETLVFKAYKWSRIRVI
jgi:hypothetical protein